MKANSQPERWTVEQYEVVSLNLTDKYVAVFIDGDISIRTEPINAIAVAKVLTRYRERDQSGHAIERQPPDVEIRVVGLSLTGGEFVVCDGSSDYAGMARVSEDVELKTWTNMAELRRRNLEKIIKFNKGA